jgi:phage protein D
MNLQPTEYKVIYEGKNITKDVSDYLLSLSYTDKNTGESDEIELEFHDKDLLWQNDWYPEKGSKIQLQIIDGNSLLDCGTFNIDEVEYKSERDSADTVSIRGMAASVTKALRTKTSSGHENKTLKELCNTIAAKHGLKVQGTIDDVTIGRITQYRESDLSFLFRIAEKYGYSFSVRDNLLVFTSLKMLYKQKHVLTLDKSQCTSFSFKDSSKEAVQQASLAYHDPWENKNLTASIDKDDMLDDDFEEKGDAAAAKGLGQSLIAGLQNKGDSAAAKGLGQSLVGAYKDKNSRYDSVDNLLQAELIANAAMRKSIVREQTVSLTCPGNVLIVTGNQIELTSFGKFSGIYYVIESRHSLDRSTGYVTEFSANKTGKVKSKHKKKKKGTDDDLPVEGPDYNEADDSENVEE